MRGGTASAEEVARIGLEGLARQALRRTVIPTFSGTMSGLRFDSCRLAWFTAFSPGDAARK